MHLSSLHIYPIKGCGGISAESWEIDGFGFRYDRRWVVVTPEGHTLTQRDLPRLALIRPRLAPARLVAEAPEMPLLETPLAPRGGQPLVVDVWDDRVEGCLPDPAADRWLTRFLGVEVRLAYMLETAVRPVDPAYAPAGRRVSFADGFPFLLLGEGSLAELNRRLETPIPLNRFRPNLVIRGAEPFAEDRWRRIRIGELEFSVVKPCARCMVTTTDQATAERGVEPLRTLATFRRVEGEVMFGQNVLHEGEGRLRIGDPLTLLGSA